MDVTKFFCEVCDARASRLKCGACGLNLCYGCANTPEHEEHDAEHIASLTATPDDTRGDAEEAEYLLIEGRDSNPYYQSNDLDEELADALVSARQ